MKRRSFLSLIGLAPAIAAAPSAAKQAEPTRLFVGLKDLPAFDSLVADNQRLIRDAMKSQNALWSIARGFRDQETVKIRLEGQTFRLIGTGQEGPRWLRRWERERGDTSDWYAGA